MSAWVSCECIHIGMGKATHESRMAQNHDTDFSDLLEEYGVRIRFIGRRELLPPEVFNTVLEMERMTANNNR
jgi:undecaprenyl pyrophosphate synthase